MVRHQNMHKFILNQTAEINDILQIFCCHQKNIIKIDQSVFLLIEFVVICKFFDITGRFRLVIVVNQFESGAIKITAVMAH